VNPEDRNSWLARYNDRLAKYGVSPEALGWGGGRERQFKRFRAAIEFSLFGERPIGSILDVGCGFGDFGAWLAECKSEVEYTGIDINPALVKAGRERYGLNLSATDVTSVPDKSFDLVVANGIFNFRMQHEEHEAYIKDMLNCFMRIARVGIAVDFMSTYVDFSHPGAFHCPEVLVIDAVKLKTKRYVVRNDYLDYEYMMYAYL
jgi:ubiquinone/menaquinone biosynthesis C-methylase UbiE